ncbi:MAG TPA: SDR family oxidoreductase [Candidatus Sulfotelmatobacter sp.]
MILVTGASGLLGASLVALAQEQGYEVTGMYHRHPVNLGAPLQAADLTQESELHRVFEEIRPAAVIHCAAATQVDWCQEHPEAAHALNVTAAARIAEIPARTGAQFLYISTDSVFDGVRGHYSETDEPAPVNVYAQTKWQGEQAVLRANPLATIARVNLYGWNAQSKQSLGEWILQELVSGNPVPGFTDAIFCPLLANDLAAVLLAMVHRNLTGLYHVAGGEPVSKYEFARRLALTFGFDPARIVPTRMADSKLKAPRPRNTSLNTEKICAALGISLPDVDSGLRRFAKLQTDGYVDRLKRQVTGARG